MKFISTIKTVTALKTIVSLSWLPLSSLRMISSSEQNTVTNIPIDQEYPGTALQRLQSVHNRVASLLPEQLNDDWSIVRKSLLWAGGLKDINDALPGHGYTGHSFNDFNHVDLTTMLDNVTENDNLGRIPGIAFNNPLGRGIRTASLPELGPGGSWTTCMIGCQHDPPQDVAHVQFRSRIAFKLIWAPPDFRTFVLVDDDGKLLNQGKPNGTLPHINERRRNYATVRGSKYAVQADLINTNQQER